MKHYGLKQKGFAAKLELSEATVSGVFRGRTEVTLKILTAVNRAFPGVSLKWLLYGTGEMLLPLGGQSVPAVSAILPDGALIDLPGGGLDGAQIGQNGGFGSSEGPSLFDGPAENGSQMPLQSPQNGENSASNTVLSTPMGDVHVAKILQEYKKANGYDKPARRIKEIRVFYDDGTFEAFAPQLR